MIGFGAFAVAGALFATTGLSGANAAGVAAAVHIRSEATSETVSLWGAGQEILATTTTVSTSTGTNVVKDENPDLELAGNALPTGGLIGAVESLPTNLGVLTQTTTANADTSANAISEVASADIDLGGITGGATDAVAQLKLQIGAVKATATQTAAGAQSGDYNIAGVKLVVGLPILKDVLGQVTAGLDQGQAVFEQILTPLIGTLSSLGTALGCTITPVYPQLSDLIADLTTFSLAEGAITVDLVNGTITVDVAALLAALDLDINNLPPYTDLIPYIFNYLAENLADALATLVSGLINELVVEAIDSLGLSIAGAACPLRTVLGLALALNPVPDPLILNSQQIANGTLLGVVPLNPTVAAQTLLGALQPVLEIAGSLEDAAAPLYAGLDQLLTLKVNLPKTVDLGGGHTQFRQGAVELSLFNIANPFGGFEGLPGLPPLPVPGFAPAAAPYETTGQLILTLADASVTTGQIAQTTTPPPTTPAPPASTPAVCVPSCPAIPAGASRPAGPGVGLTVGLALLVIGTGGVLMIRRRKGSHL